MKGSPFERVIGAIPEAEKEHILSRTEEQFVDQKEFGDLIEGEREKTPQERHMISFSNRATNALRRKYGMDDLDVPADNIHVVPEEAWPQSKADTGAFYAPRLQGVAVRDHPSSLSFLARTFHEMLHFKSYQALQVTSGPEAKVEEYRLGLIVHSRDGQHTYFTNLNEAVTEELAKRFAAKWATMPLFAEETRRTRSLAKQYADKTRGSLFSEDTYYAELLDKHPWRTAVGRLFGRPEASRRIMTMNFTYGRERKMLTALVDKLFLHNKAAFTEKEQVFDLFVRGMMTGNLLPIGRLIDKTFGQGTFRRIGEMDTDPDTQLVFVQRLP